MKTLITLYTIITFRKMTQHKFDLHKHFLLKDANFIFVFWEKWMGIFQANIIRSIDKKRYFYDVSSIL